jgi:transposase
MFNFSTSLRIYLHVKPVDMRKAFNGLYAVAKHELGKDPMDGSLFVFCNQSRNRVKLLYFDGTGFWVMAIIERIRMWIQPLYDRIDQHLRRCHYLQLDDAARQRGDGASPGGVRNAGALGAA